MAIDWLDQRREDKVRVTMVSPTDFGSAYGELEGVDLSGSSLNCAYYSDTRSGGRIRVAGGGWVRGSALRVTHEVPAAGYRRELGTWYVTADPATRGADGTWGQELTLQSPLWALSRHVEGRPWTVAKGASALSAMRDMLRRCGRPCDLGGARDLRAGSTLSLDESASYLRRLFELAKASGNRVDLDGLGRVTVRPYVVPAQRVPSMRIDVDASRGVVHEGVTRESTWLSMPSQSVVACKWAEPQGSGRDRKSVERVITARADARGHASPAARGYTVTDYHSEPDMQPRTQARAERLARQYLARASAERVEWRLTCQYLPLWEGDVVRLNVTDGPAEYRGLRKCLVKSVELRLDTMQMGLTLKETGSPDEED